MTGLSERPDLRLVLRVDGAACLLMGLGLAVLALPLASLTDIAPAVLRTAGLLLLPVGAFILAVAARPAIPAWGVALIVAGNAAWVAASVMLPFLGPIQPNPLGWTLLLGQAAAVAGLAALEHAGRPRRPMLASDA